MVRSVLRVERSDRPGHPGNRRQGGRQSALPRAAGPARRARRKDLRIGLMVPDTIHDVVMARIDRLPERAEAASADRRCHRPGISVAPAERGLAGAADRPKTCCASSTRLEFVYERVEARGVGLRLSPCADAGDGVWQPARAASPRPPRRRRTRPRRALSRPRATRWPSCWRFISAAATRPKRRSITRSSRPKNRSAAGPTTRRWPISTTRCAGSIGLPDTEPNRLRRIDAVIKQAEVKFALGRHAEHIRGARPNPRPRRRDGRPAPPRHLALLARVFAQPDGRPARYRDRPLQRGGDARSGRRSGRNQGVRRILSWPRST